MNGGNMMLRNLAAIMFALTAVMACSSNTHGIDNSGYISEYFRYVGNYAENSLSSTFSDFDLEMQQQLEDDELLQQQQLLEEEEAQYEEEDMF
jgi:vacuolar-type H+-ATPase catalytic subunit A/Vma1